MTTMGRGRRAIALALGITATMVAGGSAHAADGRLDPTFGSGGLARLASDVRGPAHAVFPLPGGKVLTAGQTSNDTIVVTRLTSAGAPDPTFGTGGRTTTSVRAAGGFGALGLDGSGRPVVVGASGGSLAVQRLTADGANDPSWGVAGVRTVSTGGDVALPTDVALSGGDVLVSFIGKQSGSYGLAVARISGALGLVPTFGGGDGIASAPFTQGHAGAFGLSVLPDGKILVAGATLDGSLKAVDTALARFTPSGALDSTFDGDGRLLHDLGGADGAFSLAVDGVGRMTLAGPSGTGGYVARLAAGGARDAGFGANGVVAGTLAGAAAGEGVPQALTLDEGGRIVVIGRRGNLTASSGSWFLSRLDVTGPNPYDPTFDGDGRVQVPACDGAPEGATAVAATGGRILVAGGCGSPASLGVARFITAPLIEGSLSLEVTPAQEAAGRERIPMENIEAASVLTAVDGLAAAPLRGSLLSTPLRGSLVNLPLRGSLAQLPLEAAPLRGSLVSLPLRGSLVTLPLRGSSWSEVLEGFVDAPWQTLTIEQVLAIRPIPPLLDPANPNALSLADLDIENSSLAGVSVGALLHDVPLEKLPAPTGGWCEYLASQPFNCTNGVDLTKTGPLAVEARESDLSRYYAQALPLRGSLVGLAAPSVLMRMRLVDVSVERMAIGRMPVGEIADLLSCGSSPCTGTLADVERDRPQALGQTTIGQVLAKLPTATLQDVTLGQLLPGIFAADEIPYETAPLGQLVDAAAIRGDDLQRHTAGITIDCAQVTTLFLGVDPGAGGRVVPGSGRATIGGRTTTVGLGQRPVSGLRAFDLAPACAQAPAGASRMTVTYDAEPGYTLGPDRARALLAGAGIDGNLSAGADVLPDDSRDPGDGEDDLVPLDEGNLRTGHISYAGDLNQYSVTAPAGSRVTLTLAKIPRGADFDLQLYGPTGGPEATPLRGSLTTLPLRGSVVTDTLASLGGGDEGGAPNGLQDLPLRGSLVGLGLRDWSINRGETDESITFNVRPGEEGRRFVLVVSGYNGSSSRQPFVLRMAARPAAKPLPCRAPSTTSTGAKGTFPSLPLPSDRQSLFLVNRQRMASRYGAEATDAMLTRLNAFAARDDVKGSVIPVESHPTVDTDAAFGAWDADPCSTDAANGVVSAVNRVVDAVKGPLDGLRHVVLVGPHDVLPQAAVFDDAIVANERTYAEDLNFDGKDDAQSRAVRTGHFLTDDPYGDFDPLSTTTGPAYVPDVGVARLVETPAQVEAQLTAYERSEGRLKPVRSTTAGYDFVKDGAQAIDAGLRPAVPAGAAELRADEDWTAADVGGWLGRIDEQFLSVNGHYDHFRGLPAAAHRGALGDGLFTSAAVGVSERSLLFTVGCHAGLNVAVAVAGQAAGLDWPEAVTRRGALYAGNTGFGYGDTEVVAYSERLAATMAGLIGSGRVSAGQALLQAKQRYGAQLGLADPHDLKAVQEMTFYGLPMYRVGDAGVTGLDTLPREDVSGPAEALSSTITPDLEAERAETARGSVWSVPGNEPLVIAGHPIQPRASIDVTQSDGLPVHGADVTDLDVSSFEDVDPVIARPIVDQGVSEPEPRGGAQLFPSGLASVSPYAKIDGPGDRLVLNLGQFADLDGDGRGTQSINDRMQVRLWRSASDDWTPPRALEVRGRRIANTVVFNVVTDADAVGGSVLYRTDGADPYQSLELARVAPGRLSGAAVLPEGVTTVDGAIAFPRDAAGNVGQSDNKRSGHIATPIGTGTRFPRLALAGGDPEGDYFRSSPSISIEPGPDQGGVVFERSLDGGPWTRIAPGDTFTVPAPAEGVHVVDVRGSDGSSATSVIPIDATGPQITPIPSKAPDGQNGWHVSPLNVNWNCADAVAGVQVCPAPTAVTTDGEDQAFSATATDRSGLTGSARVADIDLDQTKPLVAITSPNLLVGVVAAAKVTGTASDATSGVTKVVVEFKGLTGTLRRLATVTCTSDTRRSCTWQTDAPPIGQYDVTAIATDEAGLEQRSSVQVLSVS